jgi:hypothetical protein
MKSFTKKDLYMKVKNFKCSRVVGVLLLSATMVVSGIRCRGGGGGGMSISPMTATPGTIITISGIGVDTGSTVKTLVRFTTTSSTLVVDVPAISIAPGMVEASVPPYLDTATGNFSTGTVNISVIQIGAIQGNGQTKQTPVLNIKEPALTMSAIQGNGQTRTTVAGPVSGFTIQPLPVSTAPPGAIALSFVQAQIQFMGETISTLTMMNTKLNGAVDVTSSVNALNTEISACNNLEIQLQGAINASITPSPSTLGVIHGHTVVLDTATLRTIDSLFLTLLNQYTQTTATPTSTTVAFLRLFKYGSLNPLDSYDDTIQNMFGGMFSDMQSTVLDYGKTLMGSAGAVAAVGGGLLALTGAPEAALAAAALGAVAYYTINAGSAGIAACIGIAAGQAQNGENSFNDIEPAVAYWVSNTVQAPVQNGIDNVAGEFAGYLSGTGEVGSALYDVGSGVVDLSDATTDVVSNISNGFQPPSGGGSGSGGPGCNTECSGWTQMTCISNTGVETPSSCSVQACSTACSSGSCTASIQVNIGGTYTCASCSDCTAAEQQIEQGLVSSCCP